jgi:hypothetical protein
MFKTKPISSKTLRKYVLALAPTVEKIITKDLPDKYRLIVDGLISVTMHYAAIYAPYGLLDNQLSNNAKCNIL